ncbi:MAG: formate/nitrite transporter family protein [Oscillospiraceae bacterium]|nr:formate/nitrite transporter family protein [Oscillospiraceae bacterium]
MNVFAPKEIAQNYIATGVAKAQLPISKMLVLGILAGIFIAMAGVGSLVAPASIVQTNPSIARLIGGSVFPGGLAMVLLAGSELFTGNNLLIIPVLQREITLSKMLRNWLFVYIGNFAGAMLVAWLTAYGGTMSLFNNAVAANAINTAYVKSTMTFMDGIARGILCNILVCAAVWMSFSAKDSGGKFLALFMPIMLFVLNAFEHSIANMYYGPVGLFAMRNPTYAAAAESAFGLNLSNLTWGNWLWYNLVASTIGNIIGGMVIIGISYWFIFLREPKKKKA